MLPAKRFLLYATCWQTLIFNFRWLKNGQFKWGIKLRRSTSYTFRVQEVIHIEHLRYSFSIPVLTLRLRRLRKASSTRQFIGMPFSNVPLLFWGRQTSKYIFSPMFSSSLHCNEWTSKIDWLPGECPQYCFQCWCWQKCHYLQIKFRFPLSTLLTFLFSFTYRFRL